MLEKIKTIMLKIRNYQVKEDYKLSLLFYLEKQMENYIGKSANSLVDGYALCLRDIRAIKEKVENIN